jgi:outer membrane protein TolC
MTMRMIGVSQTFPYPGKLALQTRSAREELAATGAELEATRLDVAASVKREYYELAYVDHALAIVDRTRSVLGNLIAVTEGQYSVGRGTQADVLRARVEAAHLGEQASVLLEQRRAVVARLNAALDRPSDASLGSAVVSERIARAAVPDAVAQVRFVSAALGARAADSPLLPLDSLQTLAVASSPMLRAHHERIEAQRARVELSRRAHRPDVDVSLAYGQRPGLPDMVSATVSIPLPIQKRRKQDAEVAAATAELTALEAERHRAVNELNAEIAQRVSDLERSRTQLALSLRAVLPQAQASLTSATSGYQVGRVDFTVVMDAQATIFNAETTYFRSLTDFAKGLAELERAVGAGVLR